MPKAKPREGGSIVQFHINGPVNYFVVEGWLLPRSVKQS